MIQWEYNYASLFSKDIENPTIFASTAFNEVVSQSIDTFPKLFDFFHPIS